MTQDRLKMLHAASVSLLDADNTFRKAEREDICQCLREAQLKVNMALDLLRNGAREEVVS